MSTATYLEMSIRDVIQILVVTLLWSLCYPLIDIAVADAPPLSIGAFRAVIAGVVLIAVATYQKRPWPSVRTLGAVALAGLGLTTMGFAGMFLAGGKISPGLAAVLANAQPLLAALLGVAALGEGIRGWRGVALSVGFIGIVVTALPTLTGTGYNSTLSGIGFVLLGAVGVAMGNVLLKRVADQVDAVVAAGVSLLVGAVPLWILSALMGELTTLHISVSLVVTVTVLALLGTALVSVLWLDLLQRNELIQVNVYTFLTPVFGLAIAAAFFEERLGFAEWLGVALILAAVALISLVHQRGVLDPPIQRQ